MLLSGTSRCVFSNNYFTAFTLHKCVQYSNKTKECISMLSASYMRTDTETKKMLIMSHRSEKERSSKQKLEDRKRAFLVLFKLFI